MTRVLVVLAQEARKNLTAAEALLWSQVRDRRLAGRKFIRQKVVGRYRPDFYCHEERLVVELDGTYHHNPEVQANDLERTKWLESQGLKVIRFQNEHVINHLPHVLKAIKSHFKPKP